MFDIRARSPALVLAAIMASLAALVTPRSGALTDIHFLD
jgi:hypothetical protein